MRALVLSGGGSYGAFQAGAILGLAERGAQWDLVIGTSVGALNGAFVARAPGQEQKIRAAELCDLWSSLTTPDIHRPNWFGAAFAGLLPGLHPSLRDTKPLRRLVEGHLSEPLATKCVVSAVELRTGRVHSASNTTSGPKFADWIMASAAIPLVFPPVVIDNVSYVDGGLRRNDPVTLAAAEGADEAVTLTTVAAATLLYALDGVMEGDLDAWTRGGFPGRHFPRVRVIAPSGMPYTNPIAFDPKVSARMIAAGRHAAHRATV